MTPKMVAVPDAALPGATQGGRHLREGLALCQDVHTAVAQRARASRGSPESTPSLPPWTPIQPGVSERAGLAIVRGAGGAATSQTAQLHTREEGGRESPTPGWGLPASKPCSPHP